MEFVEKYSGKEVFLFNYNECSRVFTDKNWVCLCIANQEPDLERFREFARMAIEKEVLLFMGYGEYGKLLHDTFDDVIISMEVEEGCEGIDTMTTWHDNESLKKILWQACYGLYLPERADYENIKIVCMDLDGVDRAEEFRGYIKDFEAGHIPE